MTFAHPAWGAAVLSSLAVLAHAQPTPPPRIDPGIDAQQQQLQQQRQQARQTQLRPQARPQGDDVASGTPEAVYPPDETPCFTIHHLQWQGLPKAWAWLPERLEQGTMSPVGRCLGAQGVAVLVQHAQALLVAQGYVTSRVLVEPQDLRAGTLVLRVLVGRLGRVRAHPTSDVAVHLGNALALREGEPLNLRDIEQTLENLQRLPSVVADIEIVPADQDAMRSDLVVRWQQASPWRLSLSLDDAGSSGTGRYQGAVTLSRDHALGRNDLLYLTLQRGLGDSPGSTQGATLHYSLPLGRHTLTFTASTYRYEQPVTGAFQRYVYAGRSETQELSVTRLPDAHGVYEAIVEIKSPDGEWKTKTVGATTTPQHNTMFPKDWDAQRVQAEIESAWAKRTSVTNKPNMWEGKSASGITIQGYLEPRTTAFPVRSKDK